MNFDLIGNRNGGSVECSHHWIIFERRKTRSRGLKQSTADPASIIAYAKNKAVRIEEVESDITGGCHSVCSSENGLEAEKAPYTCLKTIALRRNSSPEITIYVRRDICERTSSSVDC